MFDMGNIERIGNSRPSYSWPIGTMKILIDMSDCMSIYSNGDSHRLKILSLKASLLECELKYDLRITHELFSSTLYNALVYIYHRANSAPRHHRLKISSPKKLMQFLNYRSICISKRLTCMRWPRAHSNSKWSGLDIML